MNVRACMLYTGLACLILFLSTYLLEIYLHLTPCPLCLFQRYLLLGITLLLFMGAMHKGKGMLFYINTGLITVLSITALIFAGRQIWVQHLPLDQHPPCTAGLEKLMEAYPLLEVIKLSFNASGDCARESFSLLGFSLANWSFLAFLILAILSILMIFWQKKRRL